MLDGASEAAVDHSWLAAVVSLLAVRLWGRAGLVREPPIGRPVPAGLGPGWWGLLAWPGARLPLAAGRRRDICTAPAGLARHVAGFGRGVLLFTSAEEVDVQVGPGRGP
jgi:hypothetical protein